MALLSRLSIPEHSRLTAGRAKGKTANVSRTVHRSKRDAQLALAKLVADLPGGKQAAEAMTLGQLIERRLDDISPPRMASSTFLDERVGQSPNGRVKAPA